MTYSDVTIEQFQRIATAQRLHDGNEFLVAANIIEVFEGIPVKDILTWKVNRLRKHMAKYEFLTEEIPSDNWVKDFEFRGKKYNVVQYVHDWNVGQYVSMSNLTKSQDDIINNLHVIMAAMCGEDDIQTLSEEFKHLPITIAYPVALFFCGVMLKLPTNIQHSLREAAYQTGLLQSGVGMTP